MLPSRIGFNGPQTGLPVHWTAARVDTTGDIVNNAFKGFSKMQQYQQ